MRKSYLCVGGIVMTMVLCWGFGCKSGPATDKEINTETKEFVFREHLSDYGFFKGNLKDLSPAAGVIRYELITPLFTDYAVKDRFIVVPAGKTARYTATGVLDFPDSTIIVKNFAYRNQSNQKIMIETRLLVKDPTEKTWRVMDYLWDSTQTDAVKTIIGARIPIKLLDDQGQKISTVYQVPNTNDCKRCHMNNSVISLIGPKARNLNFTLNGHSENQLSEWARQGKLSRTPQSERGCKAARLEGQHTL